MTSLNYQLTQQGTPLNKNMFKTQQLLLYLGFDTRTTLP